MASTIKAVDFEQENSLFSMVKIMLQYYPLNKKGLLTIVRNIHVLQPCFALTSRQLHTKWSNIKMLTNKIAQGKVCFAVFFLV